MENTNRYLTGMILAACAIVFGGFFFLRGAVKTYNQVEPDISYSMPRPKKNTLYTWLFGLEGRDVQYKEVDPFKDKQAAAGVAGETANTRNDGALSAAQWRALLLAQPTKENVAKLVEAFNKKEVEAATLYLIMNDLLQSSNGDTQNAGLMIAQAVPSLNSFSAVAENYEKLNATGKTTADAYFLTYMQPSRLSILALALKSTDSVVAHRAAQVMVTGLQQAGNGGTKDPRGGRGIVTSGNSNAYAQFIPILQQLIQGSDASLAGLAQSALTQIQGLSNA